MESKHYDVVIVGAGIAGSALAHALTTLPRPAQAASPLATSSQGAYDVEPARPLRVCMLERSLAEPDRIVGELLQPGGMRALRTLGLAHCTDGIDAVPVRGYVVVKAGELVQIPYPAGAEGRSFHHGRFVQNLRGAVLADASRKEEGDVLATVDVIEATAQELVECAFTRRVIGVRATRKAPAAAPPPTEGPSNLPPPADDDRKETFHADLVVIADGCFSNFRNQVLGPVASKSITKGHFVGLILEDITLPVPQHGTVCLVKNSGPILLYQVAGRDTRMLIDIKNPLPSDLKGHILAKIVPQLPTQLQPAVRIALEKDRLRRMPNSFLPPSRQARPAGREGVVLLGDAWNMRHPLTGGGMTVALNDVVLLSRALIELGPGTLGLGDWDRVHRVVGKWENDRRPQASTINILSVALYDLFGAEDDSLDALREGCFKYFELGGDCIGGPVSLLSGLTPSPALLFRHFFAVAFYSIWVMFTHPRRVPRSAVASPEKGTSELEVWVKPGVLEYPALFIKAFHVFWTACVVFGPLMWVELRWW